MKKIYVEARIGATMADVWAASQMPAQHQRWDLRFQRISYLPKAHEDEPQRFRYSTASVDGVGISVGERVKADGSATSVLRFSSEHPLSAIVQGSGYWRYVPTDEGVRFLTGYDYTPRWKLLDLAFRPLMGWATAWSFDRLRLWLEQGITPESSRYRAMLEIVVRMAVAVVLLLAGPVAGVVGLVLAIGIAPMPGTPAARRCLRRPPDQDSDTAPGTLTTLEHP